MRMTSLRGARRGIFECEILLTAGRADARSVRCAQRWTWFEPFMNSRENWTTGAGEGPAGAAQSFNEDSQGARAGAVEPSNQEDVRRRVSLRRLELAEPVELLAREELCLRQSGVRQRDIGRGEEGENPAGVDLNLGAGEIDADSLTVMLAGAGSRCLRSGLRSATAAFAGANVLGGLRRSDRRGGATTRTVATPAGCGHNQQPDCHKDRGDRFHCSFATGLASVLL